jgi:hypothetical protein
MNITYGWKAGSHCTGDAGKVGAELESIGGQVTPDSVVELAAKHKKSELHKQFEWNNEVAGHLHRLNQARHLLACIVIEKEVVTQKNKKEVIITRAYENVRIGKKDEDGKRVYVPIDTAMAVPEHRAFVLTSIRNAINDMQNKARVYESYLTNYSMFSESMETALKAV